MVLSINATVRRKCGFSAFPDPNRIYPLQDWNGCGRLTGGVRN